MSESCYLKRRGKRIVNSSLLYLRLCLNLKQNKKNIIHYERSCLSLYSIELSREQKIFFLFKMFITYLMWHLLFRTLLINSNFPNKNLLCHKYNAFSSVCKVIEINGGKVVIIFLYRPPTVHVSTLCGII